MGRLAANSRAWQSSVVMDPPCLQPRAAKLGAALLCFSRLRKDPSVCWALRVLGAVVGVLLALVQGSLVVVGRDPYLPSFLCSEGLTMARFLF